MADFPGSLIDFQRRFPDEPACAAYLAQARWPEGFRCPSCGYAKGWELSTKAFTWECAGCGRQTSMTAGTVMHASKLPAHCLVLGGVPDGHPLQRHCRPATAGAGRAGIVQVGLAAVRQAAPRHGRPRPRALEVDETAIPLRRKDDPPGGGAGRSRQGKMLVAGGVEVHDGGPGRMRLAAIADFSARSLHAFVEANLASGATVKTDGWSGYPGASGVDHEPHVIGKMAAHIVLPWTHRVFANTALRCFVHS